MSIFGTDISGVIKGWDVFLIGPLVCTEKLVQGCAILAYLL